MRPLSIGMDASGLLRPETGIGRYTLELIRGVAGLGEPLQIRLLCNTLRKKCPDVRALGQDRVTGIVNPRLPDRVLQLLQRRLSWPTVETFLGPVDVFHASDWSHPPQRRGASVTTVHDVAPLLHPHWYAPDVAVHHRMRVSRAVAHATRIITVSEFTRDALLDLFDISSERVVAVPNGVSGVFRAPPQEKVSRRLAQLGISPPYILYVGTREARKNLPGLVDIFARVREARADVSLVLAGMRPWQEALKVHGVQAWSGTSEVEGRLRDHGLLDATQIPGLLPIEDLCVLYAGASAFVFPTLYEGFGLPALEAMACGAPVVASDRTAVPEVVSEAGIVVDPVDADAFASAVLRVLEDEDLAKGLRQKGYERAASMGWDRTAKQTLAVYREAAEAATS